MTPHQPPTATSIMLTRALGRTHPRSFAARFEHAGTLLETRDPGGILELKAIEDAPGRYVKAR